MNVSPMSPRSRPEALEEDAPDDLVRASGEVPTGVDHDDGDQAAVPEAPGQRRVRDAVAIGVHVARGAPDEGRRVRRELGRVRRGRRVRPDRRLADAEADGQGRDERRDRTEDEDEADPTEPIGAERADRGTQQQAAHLGRAVQPERLAATARGRRVGQVPAGRRVVDRGAEPGAGAQQQERQGAGEHQRQAPKTPVTISPMTISRTRAVRSASQPKIGSRRAAPPARPR